MKTSQQCVKCKGKKLWVIDGFRLPGEHARGVALAVLPHEPEGSPRFGFALLKSLGSFDLWLCAACGYSELWAKDFQALREDPSKGVRSIDNSSKGPFR